jgi:hypothetical protein
MMDFNGHKPNPGHESKTAVQTRLRRCRFIFVDEFSFLSLVHLEGMNARSMQPGMHCLEPCIAGCARPHVWCHTVFSGDPYQHEP